jgi:apolipoprotein N-acyltransferase
MHKLLSNRFFLSTICGLLLWLSWPVSGFAGFIFFAWIPFFFVFKSSLRKQEPGKFFLFTFWSMFLWNFCCTWWVGYSTLGGAALAILANSLLMTLVWQTAYTAGTKTQALQGWITGCALWLGFEWLHLNWELTWPWLSLGNVFSEHISWIQWYEFTGIAGGSLWIFLTNFLFVLWIESNYRYRYLLLACMCILVPVTAGMLRYLSYEEKGESARVEVVQPNIDPYGEKFSSLSAKEQINRLLSQANKGWTKDTKLILGPETSIPYDVWEHELTKDEQVMLIKNFIAEKNHTPFLLGASTARAYNTSYPPTFSARKLYGSEGYYDSYNSAILVSASNSIPVYHKSRLVPGVERIPFPVLTQSLNSLAIDLGGTTGSLGIQENREVFPIPGSTIIAAPIICYESIYGAFVGDYVKQGANLLCIVTNDGWWEDSPGHKQHLSYARLRAIEHRRCVARSANTGTSAFINQRGDILQATPWWVPTVISGKVQLNNEKTFYSQTGDYVYAGAAFAGFLLLIMGVAGKNLLDTFEKKLLKH